MYKKIQNTGLRWTLIVLTVIFGIIIGYWMVLYLAVPHYYFKEGRPFQGEVLYNPYQDMDSTQWKQYNFHCHSRSYLGLTNGRLSHESTIDSIYSLLGYDHYGISDYMSINRHGADDGAPTAASSYIPAYEHGYGFIRKTHQLCIGAEKVRYIDYPFVQTMDMKQYMLNKLGEQCRFAVPAHPSYTKGYKVKEMRYLSGYRLLEVFNPFGCSEEHWDAALSTGHRVYAIGDDDSHNVLNSNEVGRNFTMINSSSMNPDSIYQALDKGCSYAVDFHIYYDKPFEMKTERMKELPHLTRCELCGDTLIVETSNGFIEIADFIGQDGKTLAHQEMIHQAQYVIQPNDSYVRVKMRLPNNTFFYLNPITRHPTPILYDSSIAEINYTQTVLYYIIYLLVIGIVIWKGLKK